MENNTYTRLTRYLEALQVVRRMYYNLVDESGLGAWSDLSLDLTRKIVDVGYIKMAWQFHIRSDQRIKHQQVNQDK